VTGHHDNQSAHQGAGGSLPKMWPLNRSGAQMHALRNMSREWQQGAERFWDYDAIISMLDRPICRGYFVATAPTESWLAAMFVDVGPFSADLLYIYVMPAARGQGLATLMLTSLIEELEQNSQLEALLLEVRPSNTAAMTLYKNLGFLEVGRRKRYYSDGEDAMVLSRALRGH